MIEVKQLSKRFGDKQVLSDISVAFEKGQCNLVIGGSGSGKTVLLKCMVGLYKPEQGEVLFDQRDFIRLNEAEKRALRAEIGMVFQAGALFDSLTVAENVAFPLEMFANMSKSEVADRVDFCLKRVNLPNAHRQYPSQISGGMRKRVSVARAIALNPQYLFVDEPNSGLDPKTSIVVDNLIKEITEEYQITTIINTHDMNSVLEIGDKIIFLYNGLKHWEGNSDSILHANDPILDEFVFASHLFKKIKQHST